MKEVMYIAINKDLEGLINNPGKIGAHTAHAVLDYIHKLFQMDLNTNETIEHRHERMKRKLENFKLNGDTIIVVKASEKDMLKWRSFGYISVIDRGLTCVEPNSITAVNLGIYDKDDIDGIPNWIQRLRLL